MFLVIKFCQEVDEPNIVLQYTLTFILYSICNLDLDPLNLGFHMTFKTISHHLYYVPYVI